MPGKHHLFQYTLRHQANSSLVAEQKLGRLQPSLCPLQELLLAYGEYPAKYRLLVWDFLLRLPHKSEAFQVHTHS